MLGSRDGLKATSVIWLIRNPAGRTPDLFVDIFPVTNYYSLCVSDATKMTFQPERMSNRLSSLFCSARAAVFSGLLVSCVLLLSAGAPASAFSLNANPSVSCTHEMTEIPAADSPTAQQAAPAEPQLLAP